MPRHHARKSARIQTKHGISPSLITKTMEIRGIGSGSRPFAGMTRIRFEGFGGLQTNHLSSYELPSVLARKHDLERASLQEAT